MISDLVALAPVGQANAMPYSDFVVAARNANLDRFLSERKRLKALGLVFQLAVVDGHPKLSVYREG